MPAGMSILFPSSSSMTISSRMRRWPSRFKLNQVKSKRCRRFLVSRHMASVRKTEFVVSSPSRSSTSISTPIPEPIRKLLSTVDKKTPKLAPNFFQGFSSRSHSSAMPGWYGSSKHSTKLMNNSCFMKDCMGPPFGEGPRGEVRGSMVEVHLFSPRPSERLLFSLRLWRKAKLRRIIALIDQAPKYSLIHGFVQGWRATENP
jgi:hypothetical protein